MAPLSQPLQLGKFTMMETINSPELSSEVAIRVELLMMYLVETSIILTEEATPAKSHIQILP